MPLRLQRSGLAPLTVDEAAALRAEFDAQHCIKIPGFLDADLLGWLTGAARAARFVTRVHEKLTPPVTDLALADGALQARLFMLTNESAFFAAIERITGCGRIGCYRPQIIRQEPRGGHHDSWHSDVDGNRLIAMSVNVGERFEGSALRIRDRDGRILHEDSNAEPGDALIFRIAQGLEHRTAPLTGDRPRTVMVGWFQREPVATGAWPMTLRADPSL